MTREEFRKKREENAKSKETSNVAQETEQNKEQNNEQNTTQTTKNKTNAFSSNSNNNNIMTYNAAGKNTNNTTTTTSTNKESVGSFWNKVKAKTGELLNKFTSNLQDEGNENQKIIDELDDYERVELEGNARKYQEQYGLSEDEAKLKARAEVIDKKKKEQEETDKNISRNLELTDYKTRYTTERQGDYLDEARDEIKASDYNELFTDALKKSQDDPTNVNTALGNIDINNRKTFYQDDGTMSQYNSKIYEKDGKYYVIPTIIDGKQTDLETTDENGLTEADRYFEQTGENFGGFETEEDAKNYSQALHDYGEIYYADKDTGGNDKDFNLTQDYRSINEKVADKIDELNTDEGHWYNAYFKSSDSLEDMSNRIRDGYQFGDVTNSVKDVLDTGVATLEDAGKTFSRGFLTLAETLNDKALIEESKYFEKKGDTQRANNLLKRAEQDTLSDFIDDIAAGVKTSAEFIENPKEMFGGIISDIQNASELYEQGDKEGAKEALTSTLSKVYNENWQEEKNLSNNSLLNERGEGVVQNIGENVSRSLTDAALPWEAQMALEVDTQSYLNYIEAGDDEDTAKFKAATDAGIEIVFEKLGGGFGLKRTGSSASKYVNINNPYARGIISELHEHIEEGAEEFWGDEATNVRDMLIDNYNNGTLDDITVFDVLYNLMDTATDEQTWQDTLDGVVGSIAGDVSTNFRQTKSKISEQQMVQDIVEDDTLTKKEKKEKIDIIDNILENDKLNDYFKDKLTTLAKQENLDPDKVNKLIKDTIKSQKEIEKKNNEEAQHNKEVEDAINSYAEEKAQAEKAEAQEKAEQDYINNSSLLEQQNKNTLLLDENGNEIENSEETAENQGTTIQNEQLLNSEQQTIQEDNETADNETSEEIDNINQNVVENNKGIKQNVVNESEKEYNESENINNEVKENGKQTTTSSDEFRKLQEESKGMSDEEQQLYRNGGKRIDGNLQRRLSRVLGQRIESSRSSSSNATRVLTDSKSGNTFEVYDDVDGQTFRDCFEVAKNYTKNGELVDLHNVESTDEEVGYNDTKNFISKDGLSGFSITKDGDLISVFNASGKNGWLRAISDTVKNNTKTLDCYVSPNQNLQDMYSRLFGFKTAAIMDYNMKYDHDNIAENHNQPQVAFMINTDEDIETKHFDKDSYDEAKAYRDSFVQNSQNNEGSILLSSTEETNNNIENDSTGEEEKSYSQTLKERAQKSADTRKFNKAEKTYQENHKNFMEKLTASLETTKREAKQKVLNQINNLDTFGLENESENENIDEQVVQDYYSNNETTETENETDLSTNENDNDYTKKVRQEITDSDLSDSLKKQLYKKLNDANNGKGKVKKVEKQIKNYETRKNNFIAKRKIENVGVVNKDDSKLNRVLSKKESNATNNLLNSTGYGTYSNDLSNEVKQIILDIEQEVNSNGTLSKEKYNEFKQKFIDATEQSEKDFVEECNINGVSQEIKSLSFRITDEEAKSNQTLNKLKNSTDNEYVTTSDNSPSSIDDVYYELQMDFGEELFPNNKNTAGSKVQQIINVSKTIKNSNKSVNLKTNDVDLYNLKTENLSNAFNSMANDIIAATNDSLYSSDTILAKRKALEDSRRFTSADVAKAKADYDLLNKINNQIKELEDGDDLNEIEIEAAKSYSKGYNLNEEKKQKFNNSKQAQKLSDLYVMQDNLNKSIQENVRKAQSAREVVFKDVVNNLGETKNTRKILSRQTSKRILEYCFNRQDAKTLYNTLFKKIDDNDTNVIKFTNEQVEKVKELNLDQKTKYTLHWKENDVEGDYEYTEATLASIYHEGKISDKQVVDTGASLTRIKQISDFYTTFFQEIGDMKNEVRIMNGLAPIMELKNYFPHQFVGEANSVAQKIGDFYDVDVRFLPKANTTDSWESFDNEVNDANAKHRTGYKTIYDAEKMIDTYIRNAANVIYHTADVKNLETFRKYLSQNNQSSDVTNAIDAINSDKTLTKEEKNQAIAAAKEIADKNETRKNDMEQNIGNFQEWLERFTDRLAGKSTDVQSIEESLKHLETRVLHDDWRKAIRAMESAITANQVLGNARSAGTNIGVSFQAAFENGALHPIKTIETIADMFKKGITGSSFDAETDAAAEKSSFLYGRLNETEQVQEKSFRQKITDIGGMPMNKIDEISSQYIWRMYYKTEMTKEGMTSEQAIENADTLCASIMADRRGNAMPLVYTSDSIAVKAFTSFQLESENYFNHFTHDISYNSTNEAQAAYVRASAAVGSYLFNAAFKAITGGSDAVFNPIGLTSELVDALFATFGGDDEDDDEDGAFDKWATLFADFMGSIGLGSIAKLGLSAAGQDDLADKFDNASIVGSLPDVTKLAKTALNTEYADEYKNQTYFKEGMKLFYYLGMPRIWCSVK